MSAQQRTALISVGAALTLITLKLVTGLVTGSLAFVSEALHSSIDLVAALMTLFAVGLAVRPADPGHPWGHGKIEHLAALTEAAILLAASVWIAYAAFQRLSGPDHPEVEATWWAIVVILIVMTIDASRTIVSFRASVRYRSAALQSNALHFAGDFLGSSGVLVGLAFVRAGHPKADSIAALFVAVIVLGAAARLAYQNADILIDRSPRKETDAVRQAIAALEPSVELKKLRVREAGGHYFAEAVIGISPEAAVSEGHAVADRIEQALEETLRGGEIVVHVEPQSKQAGRQQAVRAAAMSVPGVREIHNLAIVDVGDRSEVSLHLKLPGELSLTEAHELASRVEQAIMRARPDVSGVQTHLEPLSEEVTGATPRHADTRDCGQTIRRIVVEKTASLPRALRFVSTDEGLLVYLTLALGKGGSLSDAHSLASEIESLVHKECPQIARLIIHTEP